MVQRKRTFQKEGSKFKLLKPKHDYLEIQTKICYYLNISV